MPAAVLLTTAPDGKSARRIAKGLVRKRLAACVNVVGGVESFYRWKGRVERAPESLLIIKTLQKNFRKIEVYLNTAHPYELPELIALPVRQGGGKTIQWVTESVD